MLSGALAAMGGATLILTTTSNFSHNTISGQGFIALAVLIFGKWKPFGILGAALFFGMTQAVNPVLQIYNITDYIPVDFIYMLPYIMTILVLAGFIGKSVGPKSAGKLFIKDTR